MKFLAIFLCLALVLAGCASKGQSPDLFAEPAPTQGSDSLGGTTGQGSATLPPAPTPTPAPTPAPTTTPAPTAPPEPWELYVEKLSVEEKVGQLFLARCNSATALYDIGRYHLGGFVLFANDFENETPESLRNKLQAYQDNATVPMLIAVDEEGGTVTRISRYTAFRSSKFLSPRIAYRQGGMEMVLELEEEKSQLLSSLNVNVNLGPVCDVTRDSGAFMYNRSFGEDPQTTGLFVAQTVQIMARYQVGSCLKHFPGYGENKDTHVGIAVDDRSLESLEAVDLVPFQAGIDAGCDAIMVSHTIINALDPEAPATLSPAVHAYLRQEMGFEGVIVTDDLIMQAITDQYGAEEAAVLAVLAGNDLLCSTQFGVQYNAVLEAVNSGRIPMELIDQAAARVIRWKMDLGLIAE